jgi:hypothetical protein
MHSQAKKKHYNSGIRLRKGWCICCGDSHACCLQSHRYSTTCGGHAPIGEDAPSQATVPEMWMALVKALARLSTHPQEAIRAQALVILQRCPTHAPALLLLPRCSTLTLTRRRPPSCSGARRLCSPVTPALGAHLSWSAALPGPASTRAHAHMQCMTVSWLVGLYKHMV